MFTDIVAKNTTRKNKRHADRVRSATRIRLKSVGPEQTGQ